MGVRIMVAEDEAIIRELISLSRDEEPRGRTVVWFGSWFRRLENKEAADEFALGLRELLRQAFRSQRRRRARSARDQAKRKVAKKACDA